MKINFDTQRSSENIDKSKISYGSEKVENKSTRSGYTIDISAADRDNIAYTDRGKTTEDVMKEAGGIDVSLMRDCMTIMSNSMSQEDFQKMQEEGFDPAQMDPETVVTIVDKIKATLAQSGQEIAGYNDDLDIETLTKITGNRGFASAIAECMKAHDVPVTQENVADVTETAKEVNSLPALSEGTIKYMVENGMEPTAENIYLAQHSAAKDVSRQAKGYYATENTGYLAKKAESYNWEQLNPQIEQVTEDAGLADLEKAKVEARWLIEKGIPLTTETLTLLHKINSLQFPITREAAVNAAVIAIGDGKSTREAILYEKETAAEKGAAIKEALEHISVEAADLTVAEGRPLNIRNLRAAQIQIEKQISISVTVNVSARRQLEEVRLQMTVQANMRLIKSGYAIETEPLEQLIELLKNAEKEQNQIMFQGNNEAETANRSQVYAQSLQAIYEAAAAPASVIGKFAFSYKETTIVQIAESAVSYQQAYEKAGEAYETLMTEPRADLGDSIKKAFRNVDDILEDMKLTISDNNRRAVRILGYNSMEISEENISAVKLADASVQDVLKKMTPSAVLNMIRDGKNPLTMDLGEIENYLANTEDADEAEKYSRFLQKLDNIGEITETEKESYIGIYRMMRQLEKNDGAAIGNLVEQGIPVTFKNLITAMRSSKKTGMNYSVEDSFAGVYQESGKSKSITTQIESDYQRQLSKEIYSDLSPEKITIFQKNDDITLEQAVEEFRTWESEESSLEETDIFRQAKNCEDSVFKTLLQYHQPVTVENLLAAENMLFQRGSMWKQIGAKSKEKNSIQKISDQLVNSFDSKEEAQEAYEAATSATKEILNETIFNEAKNHIDVKEMTLLHKQISLRTALSKEEQFEIPLYVGGELTAVNLRIIHSEKEKGKVSITCQTEMYGQVAAEFKVNNGQIKGYIACDKEEAGKDLEVVKDNMKLEAGKMEFEACQISIVTSKELKLVQFEQKQAQERIHDGISEQALYKVAKLFLTVLGNS